MKISELLLEKKGRKTKARKKKRKNMYTNSFRTPVSLGFGGWYWGGVTAPGDNSGEGGDGGGE